MEHQIHLGIWHDIPIFIMCFGYQLLTPTHRFESHTTKDRSKGKTRQLEPSELEEVTILWYEISGRCFLGFKTTPVNSISDNMCIYIYKFKTYLVCLWIKHFQHKYPNIFRFSNIVEHFRMVFPEKKNGFPTCSNIVQ